MEQKSTFWRSAMTYGIYLAAALILYNLILYLIGENLNQTFVYISYFIMGGGIYVCQMNYRDKELGGYIDYGNALGFGVAVMLFAGILNALYSVILLKVDPGMMEQLRIMQEENMMQQGMSDEDIEAMGKMMSKLQNPAVFVISSLFVYAFMGFIISLVTSIFLKKKDDDHAFDDAMDEIKPED